MTNSEARTRAVLEALKQSLPELDRCMSEIVGKRQIIFLDIDFGEWLIVRLPHGNRKNRRLPGVFHPPASERGAQLAEKIWAVWPTIAGDVAVAA